VNTRHIAPQTGITIHIDGTCNRGTKTSFFEDRVHEQQRGDSAGKVQ